ncbi:uncharacterized protein LOC131996018 [Stomoxys calcitrans]|uniref:uncharacterized protein LOC131996018 n=1 Tax=Stomoxys calcitrans TaxID=35570 RepID=UPI0027E360BD|nr:uncharacterized protein LOC131996018 [Stomoxys calcitrans]
MAPYPVTIFNNILQTATHPVALKIHRIVPIPKEPNVTTMEKFRQIAVLPVLRTFRQISEYLDRNNILSECQYGFKKVCGTEKAAVNIMSAICNGLDEGTKGVGAIFNDFSKAFDRVDHTIWLDELQYYGFGGNTLRILESYLGNRRQFVQIRSQKSSATRVMYGVPQDDIWPVYAYKNDTIWNNMEREAAFINEHVRINRLFLNANKTKVIRFRPHCSENNFGVKVNASLE